jgi:hypothetical protein
MSAWVSSNRRRTCRRIGVAISVMTLVGLSACSSKDDAATANSQLETANSQLDAANTQNSQLQSDLDAANATNSSLATENSTAQATNDDLTTQVATQTKRADDAEAQLAALNALFPMTVHPTVDQFNVIGSYNMTLTEAFCSGSPACGTQRAPVNANISQGPVGLIITVPTVLTTSLLLTSGNLMAATDSDQLFTCNGAPENARVSITLFVNEVSVDAAGKQTLKGLGASIFGQAAAANGCPAVSTILGAQLVPAG